MATAAAPLHPPISCGPPYGMAIRRDDRPANGGGLLNGVALPQTHGGCPTAPAQPALWPHNPERRRSSQHPVRCVAVSNSKPSALVPPNWVAPPSLGLSGYGQRHRRQPPAPTDLAGPALSLCNPPCDRPGNRRSAKLVSPAANRQHRPHQTRPRRRISAYPPRPAAPQTIPATPCRSRTANPATAQPGVPAASQHPAYCVTVSSPATCGTGPPGDGAR